MIDVRTPSNSLVWKLLEFYGTKFNHLGKWRIHAYLRSILLSPCDCNLEVERQGLRWVLNPADFVQTHLYWTNEYEPWDLLHISKWVHPGAVVFDVGANFGYYSLKLGAAVQPNGHVFAFEPSSVTCSRLKANIALNHFESCVSATRCALSDRTGSSYLTEHGDNSGAATLADDSGEVVELDTLDHFCDTQAISHINVMKIDVEGNELRVLRGGLANIKRHMPVMMIEFNSTALERAGTSVRELSDLLQTLGYSLFSAKRDRLLPFQIVLASEMVINVFCFPSRDQKATRRES
jgi:FkbM family methyltransferase